MNQHLLSVIDILRASPGRASLSGLVLASPAPQLDRLIRFPQLCPLVGWAGWHDGCDRQDYQGGVTHTSPAGYQTVGLTTCHGGQVGGGQGVLCESLIEAVNHWRLQDRGCISAQRGTGVITIPSHLASRYMRLFTTTDLTRQPFAIFEIVWKCSIYISCPSFSNPTPRDSECSRVWILTVCSFKIRSRLLIKVKILTFIFIAT